MTDEERMELLRQGDIAGLKMVGAQRVATRGYVCFLCALAALTVALVACVERWPLLLPVVIGVAVFGARWLYAPAREYAGTMKDFYKRAESDADDR